MNGSALPINRICPQTAVDHETGCNPKSPKTRPRLPLDIFYHISHHLSRADLFRLSRANNDLWSLLLYQRSVEEARCLIKEDYCTQRRQPSLYTAIERSDPLHVIDTIARVYCSVDGALLRGGGSGGGGGLGGSCYYHDEPPLHLAVLMDRRDVVEFLLARGVDVNLREAGVWNDCYPFPFPHVHHPHVSEDAADNAGLTRVEPRQRCGVKNALDIARLAGRKDMASFLLERGAEDRGGLEMDLDCGDSGIEVDFGSWAYQGRVKALSLPKPLDLYF